MAYTTEVSPETPSQRPEFALAGIVASRLDIALVTAVVAAEDALARLDERLRPAPFATVSSPARIFTTPVLPVALTLLMRNEFWENQCLMKFSDLWILTSIVRISLGR